ncbi:MAG TPA: barstar family protein [Symbiobacteriaceae bacterium]
MKLVEVDGRMIRTERDFHQVLAKALDFGRYYGNNLDALWDRLSTDVERPVLLIWKDSEISRRQLTDECFGRIVEVLQAVKEQDEQFGLAERFVFELQ